MNGILKNGQRVTLLKIDDLLAMTHRYELQVCTALEAQAIGDAFVKQRVGTVRQRGQRKVFHLDLADDDIVLDGWDLPFKADTECSDVFSGNACFNLIGDPAAIRECLETKAVFPIENRTKARVLVSPAPLTSWNDKGTIILYPEIESDSAVINGRKEASAPK